MWLGPRPRQHILPEERATARSGRPRADDLQHTTRDVQTKQEHISTQHRCNSRQHAGLGNSRAGIAESPVKCASSTRTPRLSFLGRRPGTRKVQESGITRLSATAIHNTHYARVFPQKALSYLGRTSQIPPRRSIAPLRPKKEFSRGLEISSPE